jgi:hypothetical protein
MVNGESDLLKVLIFSFLRIKTGNPPKVSPKPVAPGLINILAESDTPENVCRVGALPLKVMLSRLLQ